MNAPSPNTILRVVVQVQPIVHDVPLKAVERWLQGPSMSPKEQLAKKASRK